MKPTKSPMDKLFRPIPPLTPEEGEAVLKEVAEAFGVIERMRASPTHERIRAKIAQRMERGLA